MKPFMLWCLDIFVVRPMFFSREIAGAGLNLYEKHLGKFYGM